MNIMKGKFIVIEGPDRSGKSTLASNMKLVLEGKGHEVYLTHEPTESLDDGLNILKNIGKNEYLVLLAMFMRDRIRHNRIMMEELKSGHIVICDRYSLSSLAYQGVYFRQLFDEEEKFYEWMESTLSLCHMKPDATIYLKMDDPTARTVRDSNRELIMFEEKEFLDKANRIYNGAIMRKIFFDPGFVIDARFPREVVLDSALRVIEKEI